MDAKLTHRYRFAAVPSLVGIWEIERTFIGSPQRTRPLFDIAQQIETTIRASTVWVCIDGRGLRTGEVGTADLPLIAPRIAASVVTAGGLFPLRFAGQAIGPARLLRQPATKVQRLLPIEVDDGKIPQSLFGLTLKPMLHIRLGYLGIAFEELSVLGIGDWIFANAIG